MLAITMILRGVLEGTARARNLPVSPVERERKVSLPDLSIGDEFARLESLLPEFPPLPAPDPDSGLHTGPSIDPSVRARVAVRFPTLDPNEALWIATGADLSPIEEVPLLRWIPGFGTRDPVHPTVVVTERRILVHVPDPAGTSPEIHTIRLPNLREVEVRSGLLRFGEGPAGASLDITFASSTEGVRAREALALFLAPLAGLNRAGVTDVVPDERSLATLCDETLENWLLRGPLWKDEDRLMPACVAAWLLHVAHARDAGPYLGPLLEMREATGRHTFWDRLEVLRDLADRGDSAGN